jgi:hypothetical protein
VIATVQDCHFGSGSGLEPNRHQIGSPGRQYTRTVNSGTVQTKSPHPSELGGSSVRPPAGPFVNIYTALAFAI